MRTTQSDPRDGDGGGDETAADKAWKTALLRRAFAPWDERAWENLAEAHPEAAAAIEALIAEDLIAPEDLRRYAADNNYLDSIGGWLANAAAHVQRRRVTTRPATPPDDSGE